MTFVERIKAYYTDSYGLVTPHPARSDEPKGSDNGVCFSAEFLVLYMLQAPYDVEGFNDAITYYAAIEKCEVAPGLLARSPGDRGNSPPDDLYAVAAFGTVWSNPHLCERIYQYGLEHWGSYSPEHPDKWTFKSFLWRQPQLLAAIMAGAGRKVPFVLAFISAIVIAFSCRGKPLDDTDSRRLAWLLIQALRPKSKMVAWASKLWYKRLYRDYGTFGMGMVRLRYYHGMSEAPYPYDRHPFVQFSVD